MLNGVIGRKVARLREALGLMLGVAADMRARAAILACYAAITRDPSDAGEVELTLRLNGARFPVRMRHSDIFTLAEVCYAEEYRLRTAVRDSPIVLDCGANIGLAAIWFLARFPGASVHCFEPEPENFRLLSHNLGSRADVRLNRAAVGKRPGSMRLHMAAHGAMHSLKMSGEGERTVDVEVVNVADYLDRHRLDRVDILKLDVEGSEMDAVEGLEDHLGRIGLIVGELHETIVNEHEFGAYLQRHGFRAVRREDLGEAGVHMFEMARA